MKAAGQCLAHSRCSINAHSRGQGLIHLAMVVPTGQGWGTKSTGDVISWGQLYLPKLVSGRTLDVAEQKLFGVGIRCVLAHIPTCILRPKEK